METFIIDYYIQLHVTGIGSSLYCVTIEVCESAIQLYMFHLGFSAKNRFKTCS